MPGLPKASALAAIQDAETAMQKLANAERAECEALFVLVSMKSGVR